MSRTCSQCLQYTENVDSVVGDENYKRRTPLMSAAFHGHVGCMKFLLATALDDDINKADIYGLTALMLAAENGHVECIKCLLDTRLVDVNKVNCTFSTAFMLAAKNGHVECIKCFVDRGLVDDSNINKVDVSESTALMLSAENGHDTCVTYLLACGLKININKAWSDRSKTTAFMLAVSGGHVGCVKILLDTGLVKVTRAGGIHTTALMLASSNGHLECVRILLGRGLGDINGENYYGMTALKFAAEGGHVECLKFLLATGMIQDINGESQIDGALINAAEHGQLECIKCLLDTGLVDIDSMSTALLTTAAYGNLECVKCLLETGLIKDINKEYRGSTIFMWAAEHGQSDCVKYLLDTGLIDDINKENEEGHTAFMLAMSSRQVECVKCLLDTGLVHDINKEDKSGRTALMHAAANGRAENIKYLLDTGLIDNLNKFFETDSSGDTAFVLAAEGGHTECLRCFMDISVTNEIPSCDTNQDVSSVSLFIPNAEDSATWFTYTPDITWKSPYIHGCDQQGQSILKVVVGRGLARCVICLLLGNLDVPITGHSVCPHDGLDDSTILIKTCAIPNKKDCVDYVLQFERIRFHILVVLFQEEYARTTQVSLVLYKKLCSLIPDFGQRDCFLRMICGGSHPGRCVDFLLSAFICQEDETGCSALSAACSCWTYSPECFGILLQHIFVEDSHSLPDSIRAFFVDLMSLSRYRIFMAVNRPQLREQRLNLFLINGIFCWSWYHECQAVRYLARALVLNGYSPQDFEWQGVSSSPLHHAFMTGDDGLVRYLISNLYLTSRDMKRFQMDTSLRDYVLSNSSESLQSLHRQIFGTPWRLQVLSLVKVSTLLKCQVRIGPMSPVQCLPIPQVFKEQLSFLSANRMVEMKDWDSLNVDLI